MADGVHSTGRGGAGNIGVDKDNVYVDGDIVREGVVGQSSRGGDYSAGRGGAGNIVDSPRVKPAPGVVSDDVIPETAMRTTHQENFHTGRGGEGNVHKEKPAGEAKEHSHEGGVHTLVDKAKHLVGMDKNKPK